MLEVDFKQLKIENKQYLEKIEEKNNEMTKLKKMVGLVTQTLNYRKVIESFWKIFKIQDLRTSFFFQKQLAQFSKESELIKAEMATRKSILDKVENETIVVEKEHLKEETKNRRLREQLENYKVPEVNDYVQTESHLYNLQKELKVWERKVEIAEVIN